jgi:uncharacterized membrane protein
MKTVFGLAALLSLLACSAGTALACAPGQNAEVKNGEQYCYGTSDGGGESYTPSSFEVTTLGHGSTGVHSKAYEAALLARLHRQRFH